MQNSGIKCLLRLFAATLGTLPTFKHLGFNIQKLGALYIKIIKENTPPANTLREKYRLVKEDNLLLA